jgi:polyferredoxin
LAEIKRQRRHRLTVQALALVLGNANWRGFIDGTIYQGSLKSICLPGLNCYSCPGALGACPLGILQNGLADPLLRIPLYGLGFLVLLGVVLGRMVCGWLCPFGLVQELLHKIPLRKLRPELAPAWHRGLLWGKFILLIALVILTPLVLLWTTGYGIPAFCTYVCPSGTLMAGIPLLLANTSLRALAGWLFGWKLFLLVGIVALSCLIFRPFCRYLCPLGAIYGLFNRISLYRVTVDDARCTHCGACTRHCPMAVPVPRDPNQHTCIRCGECAAVCPQQAIHCGFARPQDLTIRR